MTNKWNRCSFAGFIRFKGRQIYENDVLNNGKRANLEVIYFLRDREVINLKRDIQMDFIDSPRFFLFYFILRFPLFDNSWHGQVYEEVSAPVSKKRGAFKLFGRTVSMRLRAPRRIRRHGMRHPADRIFGYKQTAN